MVPPRLPTLLLAAVLCCASGCFGGSQNPSYFPYLHPFFGDIIQTHAKPPGSGYYANFDPHAVRLEVRPLESTDQVRTQHVLIATVYDEKGNARRSRRVEFLLEGVGNIIEVDESGHLPGRGYKDGTKHAVTYTSYSDNRLTRGTDNAQDDFEVRPGQTFCVISSAVEGDTYVTVYAPEIYNWNNGRVVANIRWVDATWEFPPPITARFGTQQVLTTKIFRHTDHQPLAGYRVRYRILDGPPAVLVPGQASEFTAVSDLSGNAQVAITQASPAFGINRIGIEIIRPPDPNAPSGAGVPIAHGETTVQWLAPNLTLNHTGPNLAVLNQEVTYVTTVANQGSIESQSMTVTSAIPDGFQYVRSSPPAFVDGKQLIWTLGLLGPNATHTIQTTYKALRQGSFQSCADLQSAEGQKDEKCVTTQVATAALRVSMTGPSTAILNVPFSFQITVSNPSNAPLENVSLTAQLDDGLDVITNGTATIAKVFNTTVGTLGAQDSRTVTLQVTPRVAGRLGARVTATAGTLSERAEQYVIVQQPQVSLSIDGPQKRYQGRPAEFTVSISNPSDVPLSGVLVRDRLPPELTFVGASQQGQLVNGEVVWNLGSLAPQQKVSLQLTANCQAQNPTVVQSVSVTADGNLRKDAQHSLSIYGLPGLHVEVIVRGNPLEVGKRIVYAIDLMNTGTSPTKQIDLRAVVPPELKVIDVRGQRFSAKDQVLNFERFDAIQPGQKATIEVEAEGLRPGDVRFRVEMSGPDLPAGAVIEEESTRIYAPIQAPPPPPPPN